MPLDGTAPLLDVTDLAVSFTVGSALGARLRHESRLLHAVDGVGYDAGPGWNPCTGLGVPNGTAMIDALVTAV